MAVPTPATWASGEVWTAALMNSRIRDVFNFGLNPDAVQVTHSAAPNISDSTWTLLPWDTETYDTNSMHGSTYNSRLVCQTPGLHLVNALVSIQSNATGVRGVQFRLNSAGSASGGSLISISRVAAGVGGPVTPSLTLDLRLSAGDYVEAFGYQTSGGTLTFTGTASFFSMRWVAS